MKKIVIFIVMIILLALDNSLCPFISIKGAAPSLLFIFVIGYSIMHEKNEAVVIGVISGMLQDIYFTNAFGINALVNIFCCLFASYIGHNIWKEKRAIPSFTVLIMSIFKFYIIFIILYVLDIRVDAYRGLFIAIYNFVIMIISYKIMFKYLCEESKETSWRFK